MVPSTSRQEKRQKDQGPDTFLPQRNPPNLLSSGLLGFRSDTRTDEGLEAQFPPRIPRSGSVVGPVGSSDGVLWYMPTAPFTHSHTFPSMSYNPNPLARFWPTSCIPLPFSIKRFP